MVAAETAGRFSGLAALAVALTVVAGSCAASADDGPDDVHAWLDKMARSAHVLNFDGIFVYSHDNALSAMRMIHGVAATGAERERLVALNGPPREVLRDNQSVTCILSDDRSVLVEKSREGAPFPPRFPQRLDSLDDLYTVEMGEPGRVAGRAVTQLVIQPLDGYRYGHRLWIDSATGLMLMSEMLDEQNNVVELFMFTSIEYLETMPEHLFETAIAGNEFTWHEPVGQPAPAVAAQAEVGSVGQWYATQLPSGFALDVRRFHRMTGSEAPMEHLVYSDGLASVSVFVERGGADDDKLVGASRMGAVSAYGRLFADHYITVVGEVPTATVRLIGESMRREETP